MQWTPWTISGIRMNQYCCQALYLGLWLKRCVRFIPYPTAAWDSFCTGGRISSLLEKTGQKEGAPHSHDFRIDRVQHVLCPMSCVKVVTSLVVGRSHLISTSHQQSCLQGSPLADPSVLHDQTLVFKILSLVMLEKWWGPHHWFNSSL